MITTTGTLLKSQEGYVLTNGIDFVQEILIEEGGDVSQWQEISQADINKMYATITPREFILRLMDRGVTRAQIEALINDNDRVWAELNYATCIARSNPLLDELCGLFGLEPEDVDLLFNL